MLAIIDWPHWVEGGMIVLAMLMLMRIIISVGVGCRWLAKAWRESRVIRAARHRDEWLKQQVSLTFDSPAAGRDWLPPIAADDLVLRPQGWKAGLVCQGMYLNRERRELHVQQLKAPTIVWKAFEDLYYDIARVAAAPALLLETEDETIQLTRFTLVMTGCATISKEMSAVEGIVGQYHDTVLHSPEKDVIPGEEEDERCKPRSTT